MFRYLFLFFVFITPAFAHPSDFPPTAFQLAQIFQYTVDKQQVDCRIGKLFEDRSSYDDRCPEILWASHVENYIHPRFPAPINWKDFVEAHVKNIIECSPIPLLAQSFAEEGTIDLIVRAIETEEAALRKGSCVLWRASSKRPEEDQKAECNLSFSLGLFSGFLNDGFKHHLRPGEKSASTFTFWSSVAYGNRLIKGGSAEFYARLKETLPEFFEAHQLPENFHPSIKPARLLCDAESWYMNQRTENSVYSNRVEFIQNVLYPEKRILWGIQEGGPVHPLYTLFLYGVEIDKESLESIRRDSVANRGKDLWEKECKKRGNFLHPHHAVSGAGELFHPKCPFPKGSVVKTISETEFEYAPA